jgi:uncharacterized membrane protein
MFEAQDVKEHKLFAIISYLGVLCLVPLFLVKKSPFAQYHAKRGLVLFIAEMALSFVNIIPILGQMIWFLAIIFFSVMSITGMIKAWHGEKWEMPWLEKYVDKIDL